MSTPADTTPPPAGGNPPPPDEKPDRTMELLFGATEPKPEVNTTPDHPDQVGSGSSLLQAISEPKEEKKPDPKPDDKPGAKNGDTPPPKPDEPEVKVRRRRSEPPPPPPAAPTPPPPPPAPEKKEPTADEKFEAELLDEERDQLELARYAEKKDPAKYKGYAAKVTKFLKEHQGYLEKNPKALEPGSAEAEAYQVWLAKNQATLPAREQRQLELSRVAETAKSEALKESEDKFSELHDENFRRDQEPIIQKEADTFFSQLAAEALPKEFADTVKAEGLEKAKEKFPMEYQIAAEEMAAASSAVEEYRRITTTNPKTKRALKAFDPNNKTHVELLEFVNQGCADFKNGTPGEDEAMKANRLKMQVKVKPDGSKETFLTRDEYFKLPPDKRAGYWTFTHEQIILMKRIYTQRKIAARIANEAKAREAQGWVRRPAAAPTATPPPEQKGAPPAPRPAPIPSGGSNEEKPDKSISLLYGS